MNPPFLLESLVYSDFKAVAKPFTTKTSKPTLSSSQHLIRFVSLLLFSVLCLQSSVEGHLADFCCLSRGSSLWLDVSWL